MSKLPYWLPLVAVAVLSTACTTVQPPTTLEQVGEFKPGAGYPKGYLPMAELPDSLALLPAPPAAGSAAQASDDESYRALTALKSGPRGELAARDAELRFPAAASTFSCALGVDISEQATPHLHMLLRRMLMDTGVATYKAKNHYQRTRPFVVFKESTCFPKDDAKLVNDGSYPSGHSAIGWAWALALSEVAPDRSNALLQRGRAFSQSRAVCGAHWKSDVEAGRLMGSAVVASLHSSEVFRAQLAQASLEVARARAQGVKPDEAACAAEKEALGVTAPLAP